jgi:hypothetical protein
VSEGLHTGNGELLDDLFEARIIELRPRAARSTRSG